MWARNIPELSAVRAGEQAQVGTSFSRETAAAVEAAIEPAACDFAWVVQGAPGRRSAGSESGARTTPRCCSEAQQWLFRPSSDAGGGAGLRAHLPRGDRWTSLGTTGPGKGGPEKG